MKLYVNADKKNLFALFPTYTCIHGCRYVSRNGNIPLALLHFGCTPDVCEPPLPRYKVYTRYVLRDSPANTNAKARCDYK